MSDYTEERDDEEPDEHWFEGLSEADATSRRAALAVINDDWIDASEKEFIEAIKGLYCEICGYLNQIEIKDAEIKRLRERLGLPRNPEVAE